MGAAEINFSVNQFLDAVWDVWSAIPLHLGIITLQISNHIKDGSVIGE